MPAVPKGGVGQSVFSVELTDKQMGQLVPSLSECSRIAQLIMCLPCGKGSHNSCHLAISSKVEITFPTWAWTLLDLRCSTTLTVYIVDFLYILYSKSTAHNVYNVDNVQIACLVCTFRIVYMYVLQTPFHYHTTPAELTPPNLAGRFQLKFCVFCILQKSWESMWNRK